MFCCQDCRDESFLGVWMLLVGLYEREEHVLCLDRSAMVQTLHRILVVDHQIWTTGLFYFHQTISRAIQASA